MYLVLSTLGGYIGFGLLVVGMIFCLRYRKKMSYVGRETAQIVNVEKVLKQMSDMNPWCYKYDIEMQHNGKTYFLARYTSAKNGLRPVYNVGDTVIVRFCERDPYKHIIEGDKSLVHLSWFTVSLGGVLLLLAIGSLIVAGW